VNLKVSLISDDAYDEEEKIDYEDLETVFRMRCSKIVNILELVYLLQEKKRTDSKAIRELEREVSYKSDFIIRFYEYLSLIYSKVLDYRENVAF